MDAQRTGCFMKNNNYYSLPYNPNLREKARENRKAGILSEVLLWQQLHKRKFQGYNFDRQKIIGNYIVDFYCVDCKVVIEVDGSSHDFKFEYDSVRDEYLKSLNLEVIHISAVDVLKRLNDVMIMLENHQAFEKPG